MQRPNKIFKEKVMKKILTVLIVLALSLCIVACGDDDNKKPTQSDEGQAFTFGKTGALRMRKSLTLSAVLPLPE